MIERFIKGLIFFNFKGKLKMNKIKFPKEQVIIPDNFRYIGASPLDGRYKSLMKEVGRLAQYFEDKGVNKSVLRAIKYNQEKGVFQGSNVPSVVLVNMALKGENYRTATQQDLEYVMFTNDPSFNASHLRNHYVDSGLALRNDQELNEYQAKYLINQIQTEFGSEFKLPYKLDLNNLELRLDLNSQSGLVYHILDLSRIVHAPILNEKTGKFSSNDPGLLKIGLPYDLGEGSRSLYTTKHGLCGLLLYWGWGVSSRRGRLGNSDSVGLVVVVSEADAQKFKHEINQRYEERARELELKRQNALSLL